MINRTEYGNIVIIIGIGVVLSVVLLGLAYILGEEKGESEKVSIYECGFDAFGDAREEFDVHFYIVGVLFIIFDLESCFVIVWGLVLERIGDVGFLGMVEFLVELCIGYMYAWKRGVIRFNK